MYFDCSVFFPYCFNLYNIFFPLESITSACVRVLVSELAIVYWPRQTFGGASMPKAYTAKKQLEKKKGTTILPLPIDMTDRSENKLKLIINRMQMVLPSSSSTSSSSSSSGRCYVICPETIFSRCYCDRRHQHINQQYQRQCRHEEEQRLHELSLFAMENNNVDIQNSCLV